jgi:hypothetical protein
MKKVLIGDERRRKVSAESWSGVGPLDAQQ